MAVSSISAHLGLEGAGSFHLYLKVVIGGGISSGEEDLRYAGEACRSRGWAGGG